MTALDSQPRISPGGDRIRLIALIILMTGLRMGYAALMPMIAGESYYWLWSHYPAAGYFDHPPLTGWVNFLIASGAVGSTLLARLPAILLAILATLAVYGFARSIYPCGPVPWRAAFLFSIIPIFDFNAMFPGPDNSLILAMVLTWLLFWRAAERGNLLGWMLAGVGAGLALLSKFHAWILLPPLWFFLYLSPAHRPRLRTPGPWLAIVVALLVLSPNLIWNARHDWLNYAFQMRRSGLPRSHLEIKNVFHYVLMPLLSLSPLVYAALIWAVVRGFRAWHRERDPRALYLLCAGLPLPVFLGILTPLTKISIHWPAAGYLPLLVLALGLAARGELYSPRYARFMIAICIAFTAMIHLSPTVVMHIPDGLIYRLEPLADSSRIKSKFPGWHELGARIRAERDALAAENPSRPAVIMAKNWHLTSQLAFYSRRPREAFVLNAEDAHNYALWMASRNMLRGADAIVVIEKEDPNYKHSRLRKKYDKYVRMLSPLFDRVDYIPSLMINRDGSIEDYLGVEIPRPRLQEYLIFRCRGWRGKLASPDIDKPKDSDD